MPPHDWKKSDLENGEVVCGWCRRTGYEAAILGILLDCDKAPEPGIDPDLAAVIERARTYRIVVDDGTEDGRLVNLGDVMAGLAAQAASPGRSAPDTANDLQEVLADHQRLTRELDISLHGEAGAAPQASLCDLIGSAREMRETLSCALTEYEGHYGRHTRSDDPHWSVAARRLIGEEDG